MSVFLIFLISNNSFSLAFDFELSTDDKIVVNRLNGYVLPGLTNLGTYCTKKAILGLGCMFGAAPCNIPPCANKTEPAVPVKNEREKKSDERRQDVRKKHK